MIVKYKKTLAVAAGAGMVVAGLLASSPAAADPNGAPTFRVLAGVGSDTTDRVMNGLSDVVLIGGVKQIASYDATGSATITTKDPALNAACANLPRPNGSTAGRNALLSSLQANANAGNNCIDFARSSSSRGTFVSVPSMTFVPFAVDTTALAVRGDGGLPRAYSVQDAIDIYKCLFMPDVVPRLIQAGSGSRSSWLGTVGITEAQISAGTFPCLIPTGTTVNSVAGTGRPAVQENDGRDLKTDEVMPYGVANYTAQSAGVTGDLRGSAVIAQFDGKNPQVLNSNAWPVTRTVNNIIPTSKIGTAPWSTVFVGAGSLVCSNTATIQRFGYAPAANCGDTTSQS